MQHTDGGYGNVPSWACISHREEKQANRDSIVMARAIESFFTCMADAGYVPHSRRIKRADVVVFSLSTAIRMHCYSQEREVFRSKYLNVLDRVFGVPPSPGESPRCSHNTKARLSPSETEP